MAKTIKSYGRAVVVSRVPVQKCAREECDRQTKLAVVMPLADIEDDGTPGLGAVVVCSEHIEEMVMKLSMA